ncbi:TauD/TfdA family dioxygenase [Streptomyces sp. NPDC097617]|uniref:TauD/TfdA family dioxygenase n=1 Tax=Streptomyces sp. NPDC097617 TaxID=3366091 RepID=UPI003828439D
MLTPTRTRARFEDFYVDPRDDGSGSVIARQLRELGAVTVDGLLSRKAVLGFLQQIMTLAPHPDSDPDGLTTIKDIGCASRRPGLAGLGSGELRAHTERSGTPTPPRLMLLVCLRPATSGGEVLLTDGRAIQGNLATRAPEAMEAMSRRGTAFYGGGGGHPSSIFTPHPAGRLSIRFRQDELGQFSPLVTGYLPALRSAISAHENRLDLQPGQGYLIDNHRYLHARTAFIGPRLCVRALGTPLFQLTDGFAAAQATARSWAGATAVLPSAHRTTRPGAFAHGAGEVR